MKFVQNLFVHSVLQQERVRSRISTHVIGKAMDLIDQLRALASRIAATKDIIQTEEATKNAMIMPFI